MTNTNQSQEATSGKEPLRILHCVAGLARGGYETFIMNVYRNIDRQKVQFDFLYSFDGVFNDEIRSLGGRIFQIPFITQCGPFAYQKNVDNFLKSHKEYNIIHSHMDKFSGLIMRSAKKNGVAVRVAHSHNTQNEGGFLFKAVKNYYGNLIKGSCTHRVACSKNAYTWLFGKENTDFVILKNGVQLSDFKSLDLRDKAQFTISNIARFTQQKNHELLLDIFHQLYIKDNTARLVLAGTGELQSSMREKAKRLGISEVVSFIGDCNDVPALLAKTDVLCMPSLFEGLPVSLIEAQAAGVKCVISDKIPAEVDISGNVTFVPLNQSCEFWADEILKQKGYSRENTHDLIRENGYDIQNTAQALQKFYLENGTH